MFNHAGHNHKPSRHVFLHAPAPRRHERYQTYARRMLRWRKRTWPCRVTLMRHATMWPSCAAVNTQQPRYAALKLGMLLRKLHCCWCWCRFKHFGTVSGKGACRLVWVVNGELHTSRRFHLAHAVPGMLPHAVELLNVSCWGCTLCNACVYNDLLFGVHRGHSRS